MARIVFPVSSAPGSVPQEGSGRLINAFAVKTEQGNRSPLKWLRSAGLREMFDITGHSHFRGGIEVGSTAILVMNERVYTVTESAGMFTAVNRGALAGTDPVTIAKNKAATPNIVAVGTAGTFNLFTGSAPTTFADGDWAAANSVTEANGYIVGSTGAGLIQATDLNAVTIATNSNESAEMPLRRVVFHRGQLFAMGESGIKVYDETGDSPFPFRYNKSVGILPGGLCGTHAVAGFEDGWIKELCWVGEDNIAYQLVGYKPTPISNDDVSRAIASAADRTLIEASVYMNGKNALFVITLPGVWTWEYNVTTGSWNERQSYETDDWRARRCIRAFDRWMAGDYTTGKFAAIDNTYKREYGDPLIFHVESGDNAAFPHNTEIPSAHFDFAMGEGEAAGEDPVETDPQVMISWSMNGGYNWGSEVRRSLGRQGEGSKAVVVNRVGTTKAKGVRFRVRVSDPVDCVFMGGELPDIQALAA